MEISDTFEADLTAGDGYAVEVTVDDNLVDHLQVEQHGDTVKIGLKPFTAVGNAHLRARITLPTLAGLDVSGASRASVTGFRSDRNVQIKASGASEIRGDMETGDLAADVSGGSTLQLNGRGQRGTRHGVGREHDRPARVRHGRCGRGGLRRQPHRR